MKQRLKLLGTLLTAVLLGACGLLKENAVAPTTPAVQETTQAPRVEVKADGTYTEKEYTFVSNGKKIYARAYIPDVQGQVPLVMDSEPAWSMTKKFRKPWRSPEWRCSALNSLAGLLPPLQKARGPRRKCPS